MECAPTVRCNMPRPRPAILVLLAYVTLGIAITHPLVFNLASAVPSDLGDPLLNTWILWWNARAVPLTAAWWDAPSFFPAPDSLALSEHLLGLAPLTSPIIWLTGNAQLAYNVAFLLTFILSAAGAHYLAFVLTGRHDAGLVAGLAFACAPYRMAQFPHLQTLVTWGLPVALASLHRYLQTRQPRWLAIFATAYLLQGLSNGYFLMFFPVLLGLWVLWFVPRRAMAPVLASFAAASLPLVPFLLHYKDVHDRYGLERGLGEILTFSADVSALAAGTDLLALWGRFLLPPGPEAQLFPGVTVVALVAVAVFVARRGRATAAGVVPPSPRARRARQMLAVAAVTLTLVAASVVLIGPWRLDLPGLALSVKRLNKPLTQALLLWVAYVATGPRLRAQWTARSPLTFYVGATLVMWVLACGPFPAFRGEPVIYWAPYRWLMLLPGFDGLRVPARFTMLATLCLAAAAGLAIAQLRARLSRPGHAALVAIVAAGLLAEGWIREMPLRPPPPPSVLSAADGEGAVLELPLGDAYDDVASMHRAMAHGRRLVNGFSGYAPPYYDVLRIALERREAGVLDELVRLGLRHVVVHLPRDADGATRAHVEAVPGARLVRSAHGQALYELPRQPAATGAREHGAEGRVLPVARVTASVWNEHAGAATDGNLTTRWDTGGPQRGGETLDVDLGAPAPVAAVELTLGPFRADFPRELVVERSLDGASWTEAWRGRTGVLALTGALDEPRRLPVRIPLDAAPARHLRLRQVGSDDEAYWSVTELVVRAP